MHFSLGPHFTGEEIEAEVKDLSWALRPTGSLRMRHRHQTGMLDVTKKACQPKCKD